MRRLVELEVASTRQVGTRRLDCSLAGVFVELRVTLAKHVWPVKRDTGCVKLGGKDLAVECEEMILGVHRAVGILEL